MVKSVWLAIFQKPNRPVERFIVQNTRTKNRQKNMTPARSPLSQSVYQYGNIPLKTFPSKAGNGRDKFYQSS